MKCSLGISNFLEEISSLFHSAVFLYFFALIDEEGFLISPCYSLELCIHMLVSFLFSFAFHFSVLHRSAVAKRSYPMPKVRGFSQEEQPQVQGAVAARAQEGREELLHSQGQEGRL